MKLTLWLSRMLAKKLAPQHLLDLVMEVWPHVWERVPSERRVEFLKNIIESLSEITLEGLSREDRAALMNGLLPLVVREFPLNELDILTIFMSPGDRYHPKNSNK